LFPRKRELSPLPLMRRLADAGVPLALPVVAGRGNPLIMRAWSFGAPLVAGVWGIREPPAEAPAVAPDILIVPLLAFDRRGYRLGYGAGHYAITLTAPPRPKPGGARRLSHSAPEVQGVAPHPPTARPR